MFFIVCLLLIVTPFLFNPWLFLASSFDRYYLIKDAWVLSLMAIGVAWWVIKEIWQGNLSVGKPRKFAEFLSLLLVGQPREFLHYCSLRLWKWCLIAFVVLGALSAYLNPNPYSKLSLLSLIIVILFYFALVHGKTMKSIHIARLLTVQIYTAGIVGLHCLAQHFGYEPGQLIGGRNVTTHAISYLGQTMVAGAYLAISLPLAVALIVRGSTAKRTEVAIAVLFIGLGLLATGNRAGILAAAVGMSVFAILALYTYRDRIRTIWPTLLICGTLTGGVIATAVYSDLPASRRIRAGITHTLEGNWEAVLGSRPFVWRMALRMMADRPVSGHGLGSYPFKQAEYEERYEERYGRVTIVHGEHYARAHNEFLQVWAEIGTPALLVVLLGLGSLFIHALRKVFYSWDNHENWLLRDKVALGPTGGMIAHDAVNMGLVGSLASILVVSFFGFPLHVSSLVVPIVLVVAAIYLRDNREKGLAAICSGVKPSKRLWS